MSVSSRADLWPAPRVLLPIDATVTPPGSKSLTNRALVLAAISSGPSKVRAGLHSRDTELMAQALQVLGTGIRRDDEGWQITPSAALGPGQIDCGLAGTVMRFVPPVAALAGGRVAFDGDPHARQRPMGEVVAGLRQVGVEVLDEGRDSLPLVVIGRGSVRGGAVTIDASASSQFVSGLLLAGARYDEGVDVRHDGKPIPSLPHIDMTVEQLRLHGVDVDDSGPNRWVVAPGPVKPVDVDIEPDLSNAAPFVAAALVTAGRVTIEGWPSTTTQAGDRLRELVELFGGTATLATSGLVVTGGPQVRGIDVDLHDAGELAPVVAGICLFADSPSYLRGIAHVRGHETDRLHALATEFNALGGRVTEMPDGLRFEPGRLHGGIVHTYADHRMAQAAAVVGLMVDDVLVEDIATTGKTYPGFAQVWTGLFG